MFLQSPSIHKFDDVFIETSAETCRRAHVESLSRSHRD